MRTVGKVIDASVLVGSFAVGYGALSLISQGVKAKKKIAPLIIGGLTLVIAVYAFKEAYKKINE